MHTIDMATTILESFNSLYYDLSALCKSRKGHIAAITIEEKTVIFHGSAHKTGYYFLLHIDCLQLLAKRDVDATDIPIIRNRVDAFLSPARVCIDTFFITRIDYCKNIVVSSEKQRNALFECVNKLPGAINYQRQSDKFSHGVYWHNQSRVTMLYDKQVERKEKCKSVHLYEKDIVRMECQVKTRAIKYTGLPRTFSTWVTIEMEEWYLLYTLKPFPAGDFWDVDTALDIINVSTYSPALKANLKQYLLDVESTDMEMTNESRSRDTVKKYICLLDAINVNPVTISRAYKISHISNPFYH